MLVAALKVKDTAAIVTDFIDVYFYLPSWIMSKIIPLTPGTGKVDVASIDCFDYDGVPTQAIKFGVWWNTGFLTLYSNDVVTLDKDNYMRVQFDLLIENS